MLPSKLYLVPTPIGNLDDMTYRAVKILNSVDVILAEDTRTSKVLLTHYGIETRLQSHHQFNEHKTVASLAERILNGENIALISDAGTPGISDPGFMLVRECIKLGIEVECLPGAVAFVPALVCSGLPCDRFYFEGFLPHKKGRETKLRELSALSYTFILYESPFRLIKTLQQLAQFCGNERRASVSRELTKKFEETARGSLEELVKHFSASTVKGEIVIVVEGNNSKQKL